MKTPAHSEAGMRHEPRQSVRIRLWPVGLPRSKPLNSNDGRRPSGAELVRNEHPIQNDALRNSNKPRSTILAEHRSICGPCEGRLCEVLASIESRCSWLFDGAPRALLALRAKPALLTTPGHRSLADRAPPTEATSVRLRLVLFSEEAWHLE
jgi:hypothetical protein